MKEEKELIVIVDQRMWQSIASDAVSFGLLALAMFVGVALNSAALQWVGGIVWILHLFGMGARKLNTRLTIEQARAKLDELEGKK